MKTTIDLNKEVSAIAKETGYDFSILNVEYIAERLNLNLDNETKTVIAKELQNQLVQSHLLKATLV